MFFSLIAYWKFKLILFLYFGYILIFPCVFLLQRFAAVIMRIREPKTTALIFASGKMVCYIGLLPLSGYIS